MLDWWEIWILPHSSPKIPLFAFFSLLGSSSTFFKGRRHRWQAEGLERVERNHVLESCVRGIWVSFKPMQQAVWLCTQPLQVCRWTCDQIAVARSGCWAPEPLAPSPGLWKVLLWLCHTITISCVFLQVKILEITWVSQWSPVVMVLEHRMKHCLLWVIHQWDVKGFKTWQDNFGGPHKDWKKPPLSRSFLCSGSWRAALPQQPQGNQTVDSRK